MFLPIFLYCSNQYKHFNSGLPNFKDRKSTTSRLKIINGQQEAIFSIIAFFKRGDFIERELFATSAFKQGLTKAITVPNYCRVSIFLTFLILSLKLLLNYSHIPNEQIRVRI